MTLSPRPSLLRPASALALAVFAIGIAAIVYAQPVSPAVPSGAITAAAPTRVGVVSPARVFSEMQETKDLQGRMENERKAMEETLRQKATRAQGLRDELKLLKPNSAQFIDKSREFTRAGIEFQAEQQVAGRDFERTQRMQMRALFDKIQATTARLAQERGYDLVLADTHSDIPENLEDITLAQLRAAIGQQNILYVRPEIDLTNAIIAALDAEYKK